MASSTLLQSIAKTVLYTDIFSYPLTLVELRRWLLEHDAGAPVRMVDIARAAQNGLPLNMPVQRRTQYRITALKLRRARRVARFFSHFPFVRFIGVVNRVSWGIAHPASDIDFFIVVRSGRLWMARFLITGMAALFGWRPTSDHSRDTICLSFYLADGALDMSALRFQERDIHFAFWLYQLFPIYDEGGVLNSLFKANRWLNSFFGVSPMHQYARMRSGRPLVKVLFEFLLRGHLGAWLETVTRRVQIKILDKKCDAVAVPYSTAVVYNDQVVKLHWNDRRKHYFDVWQNKVSAFFK